MQGEINPVNQIIEIENKKNLKSKKYFEYFFESGKIIIYPLA
jgi:hypothetical protein